MSTLDHVLGKRLSGFTRKRFRGEIWENAKRFQFVGKAYEAMPKEQKGFFKIETCRHLVGPLRAWRHPAIRKILVRKAIQTQGSMIIDLIIPFIIEHHPRNTLLLFETDPKALNYCTIRLMDTLKKHPVIGSMIKEVQKTDRFSVTFTKIRFAGMDLMVGGLNDSNVSSLSWPNVLVSEAWIHKSDGLLFKAFGRTTQFESDCKILVESQAGNEGEDWDSECQLATRVPLTWACPACGGRQEWEFSQRRPDDFRAILPMNADPGYQPPKPNSYAGMIIPDSIQRINGVEVDAPLNSRAQGAEWECYHCGTRFRDTPMLRRKLMDSYLQEIPGVDSPGPIPKSVLFDWPEETSLNISFSESAQHFLVADAAQKASNFIQKADWYMQRRGKTWKQTLEHKDVMISVGSYDPNQIMPNEHSRNMAIDVQKDKVLDTCGTFWVEAAVFDKFGNGRQLERAFCESWEECIDIQRRWKIPNSRVCVDSSHWTPQIMTRAASEFELAEPSAFMKMINPNAGKIPSCWVLLFGDDAKSFRHRDNQSRAWSPVKIMPVTIFDSNQRKITIRLQTVRWSNLSFKLQLDAIMLGAPGMPKYEILDRRFLNERTRAKETGNLVYEKQLSAEFLTEKKGQQTYEKLRKNDHYRDTRLMLMVRCAMDGLLGHIAPSESE